MESRTQLIKSQVIAPGKLMPQSPETFFNFYRSLAKSAFGEFFVVKEFTEKVGRAIAVLATAIATAIAAFNKEFAESLNAHLHVSRWWALLPVGVLFAWRMLVANYKRFEAEWKRREEAEEREAELVNGKQLKEEWEKLEAKCAKYGGGSNLEIQACWRRAMDTGRLTWYLLGGWDEASRKRFEIVINEAAQLLRASQYSIETFQELASETDALGMWALAVCDIGAEKLNPSGSTTTERGIVVSVGGTVKDFPRKCVHACAYLASQQKWI